MELYLVRHAEAVDRSLGMSDEARPLTPKGRREFARVVRGLASLQVEFDLLLHSPLLRAVETAEILVPLVRGETQVALELAEAPSNELLARCSGLRTALVGHEPWMSELAAWLSTGDTARAFAFGFKKGGVAKLEGELQPGRMALTWFLPPGILMRIGRES